MLSFIFSLFWSKLEIITVNLVYIIIPILIFLLWQKYRERRLFEKKILKKQWLKQFDNFNEKEQISAIKEILRRSKGLTVYELEKEGWNFEE